MSSLHTGLRGTEEWEKNEFFDLIGNLWVDVDGLDWVQGGLDCIMRIILFVVVDRL